MLGLCLGRRLDITGNVRPTVTGYKISVSYVVPLGVAYSDRNMNCLVLASRQSCTIGSQPLLASRMVRRPRVSAVRSERPGMTSIAG